MEPAAYSSAIPHYLSADRRDPVKRNWEEPFSRSVLRSVATGLGSDGATPLRVLDVGSGTGDGYQLLRSALLESSIGAASVEDVPVDYVGMDCDRDMVATASQLHDEIPTVSFVEGDVLQGVPDQPFDLYMSAGVPYSHLTQEELAVALKGIMTGIRSNGTRAAIIIDVLGRYSLEWPANWDKDRWDYQMTFFHDAPNTVSAPMTFHSRASLGAVIQDGAAESGLTVEHLDYFDRSIMVGRHTATGTFDTAIPAYRLLINRLYDGDCEQDLTDLLVGNAPETGPAEVGEFFEGFRTAWNARITSAIAAEGTVGESRVSRMALAQRLCDLEHGLQPGLGSGHSLIGVAYLSPPSLAA
jgi:SAM-dependent methyltransferase